jgi:predicted N-formylglutamate amidohydrolase
MNFTGHVLITCEHASNAVPPGVDLGVGSDVLDSHVAWDPGAVEEARAMVVALGAPLLAGRWTRLWVDLNRSEWNEQVVPEVAFGVHVPANKGMGAEARKARLDADWRPFKDAVRDMVEEGACLHLSIHSFTPRLGDEDRPYDLGVLYDLARPSEANVADGLMAALRTAGFDARPNVPYPGTTDGTTTWLRTLFPDARYAGLEIEYSQALDAVRRRRATETMARAVSGISPGR